MLRFSNESFFRFWLESSFQWYGNWIPQLLKIEVILVFIVRHVKPASQNKVKERLNRLKPIRTKAMCQNIRCLVAEVKTLIMIWELSSVFIHPLLQHSVLPHNQIELKRPFIETSHAWALDIEAVAYFVSKILAFLPEDEGRLRWNMISGKPIIWFGGHRTKNVKPIRWCRLASVSATVHLASVLHTFTFLLLSKQTRKATKKNIDLEKHATKRPEIVHLS